MADNPWAVEGAPAGGLPPVTSGAPYEMRGHKAPPSLRTARRPAPSSQSSTSPAKVVGWILFILLFIIIRAFNG